MSESTAVERVFYRGRVAAEQHSTPSPDRVYLNPRHVWVVGMWGSLQFPGLLLDWRKGRDGWEALVVWAAGGGMTEWDVRHSWMPARHVRPLN